MLTQDIPRTRWREFFEDVSNRFQGWSTTVEVLALDLGDQPEIENQALEGISYEQEGSEATDVLIEVGFNTEDYAVHHVDRPSDVQITESRPGLEADIQIISEEGLTTLVYLRDTESEPRTEPMRGTEPLRDDRGVRPSATSILLAAGALGLVLGALFLRRDRPARRRRA
jgi:hypothetical protein